MSAFEHALLWLDAGTVRFWCVALGLFAVTGSLAVFPSRDSSNPWARWNYAAFVAGVVLTMVAFRWPVWFYPTDLNPDEAQTVAGAITLLQHPVYWKYVDGTSHGPWCEYFLVAAHGLGAPLNYVTARIVATLLQAASVLAVWGTLRGFTTERIARVSILPALAFWSVVTWEDFVHYSSELPGIFFLALATWLAAIVVVAPVTRTRHLALAYFAGFFVGNVPFAKLQSAPPGLALGLITLWLFRRGTQERTTQFRRMVAYLAGALSPALIVSVFISIFGLWGQFWASYILGALAYLGVGQHPLSEMPSRFFVFSATEPAFAWFFWGGAAFSLVYVRARTSQKSLRLGIIVGWVLLAVAYYSVLRPAREAAHYLQLLVVPMATLTGFSLAAAMDESGPRPTLRQAVVWLFFASLTLLPQIYGRLVSWHGFVGRLPEHLQHQPGATARFILDRARPGESIAMWGWRPNLLVETGMPHGTREAHTASQLSDWPMRDYFRARYLWDMEHRQPVWFVDVVGPKAFVFEERRFYAHEAFPALDKLIVTQYEFMAEFQNERIYHLKNLSAP